MAAAANWGVARLLKAPAENNAAIRLAYIHNMGDAYVSLSPVVAGLVTVVSGYSLFDPLIVVFTNVGFKRSLLSIVVIAPYSRAGRQQSCAAALFRRKPTPSQKGSAVRRRSHPIAAHRSGKFAPAFAEGRDAGRRMG